MRRQSCARIDELLCCLVRFRIRNSRCVLCVMCGRFQACCLCCVWESAWPLCSSSRWSLLFCGGRTEPCRSLKRHARPRYFSFLSLTSCWSKNTLPASPRPSTEAISLSWRCPFTTRCFWFLFPWHLLTPVTSTWNSPMIKSPQGPRPVLNLTRTVSWPWDAPAIPSSVTPAPTGTAVGRSWREAWTPLKINIEQMATERPKDFLMGVCRAQCPSLCSVPLQINVESRYRSVPGWLSKLTTYRTERVCEGW